MRPSVVLQLLAAASLAAAFHTSSLAAMESHLAPVDLPDDIFIYRSFTNASRACVSRTVGGKTRPASFSSLDGIFGSLRDLSSQLGTVLGQLDLGQQCFTPTSGGSACLAFAASTSADCFFDPGQAMSYNSTSLPPDDWANTSNVGTFWTYASEWTVLRGQLRLYFGASKSFMTECLNAVSMISAVPAGEQSLAVTAAVRNLQPLLQATSASLLAKWRSINSTRHGSSAGAACTDADDLIEKLLLSGGRDVSWTADIQQAVLNSVQRLLNTHSTNADDASLLVPSYCLALTYAVAFAALEDGPVLLAGNASLAAATLQSIASMCDTATIASRVSVLVQLISSRIGAVLTPAPTSIPRLCLYLWFTQSSPSLNASVMECFPRSTPSSSLAISFTQATQRSGRTNTSFALYSAPFLWSPTGSALVTVYIASSLQASTNFNDFTSDNMIIQSWSSRVQPPSNSPSSRVVPQIINASNSSCPAGFYYSIEADTGTELCTECVNEDPDFIFCPGDTYQHLCSNKPLDNAAYIAQGLAYKDANCPFLCTIPFQIRTGNHCSTAPIGSYPSAVDATGPCEADAALASTPLADYLVDLSPGLFGDPASCSHGLRRRSASGSIDDSPGGQLLRWCTAAASPRGLTWTIDTTLNASAASAQLMAGTGSGGMAMELAAVEPDGWSIILGLRSPANVNGWISARIFFNSSASAGAHFSAEQLLPSSGLQAVRVAVSVDYATSLISFFLNDRLLGSPRPFVDLRVVACTPPTARFVMGGRFVTFDTQPTSVYAGTENATLPTNFSSFVGIISSFAVSSQPLALFTLTLLSAAVVALPPTVGSSLASMLFATAPTSAALIGVVAARDSLFGNPVQYLSANASGPVTCRWFSQMVGASCVQCPAGSTGFQGCSCLSSRHTNPPGCASSLSCSCAVNLLPYPPPTCSVVAALPVLLESTAVSALSCTVDPMSAPADVVAVAGATAINFTWNCTSNALSSFVASVTSDGLSALLAVAGSAAYGGDSCDITAQVIEAGRQPGAAFTTLLQILPRALPLLSGNVNIPNGSTMLTSTPFLPLGVFNYSFFSASTLSILSRTSHGAPRMQAALDSACIVLLLPNGSTTALTSNGTVDVPVGLPGSPIIFDLAVFGAGGLFAISSTLRIVVFPYRERSSQLSPASQALSNPGLVAVLSICLVALISATMYLGWKKRQPQEDLRSTMRSSGRSSRRSRRRREPTADTSNHLPNSPPAPATPPQASRDEPLGRPPMSGDRGRSPAPSINRSPATNAPASPPAPRDWEKSVSRRPRPWKNSPELPPTSEERRRRRGSPSG